MELSLQSQPHMPMQLAIINIFTTGWLNHKWQHKLLLQAMVMLFKLMDTP